MSWQLLKITPFLLIFGLSAQEKTTHSFYFDFDKFTLNNSQESNIAKSITAPENNQFDAIELFGYCDDRGMDDYNITLSRNRVKTVQEILVRHGILESKIFVRLGCGRVLIDKSNVQDIRKTRDKNRRVDVIYIKNKKYTYFPLEPKVGDQIILERILFDMGSSSLTMRTQKELDRIVEILKNHKTLQFEIKGFVCCTSNKYSDAIDGESQNRSLSINRAKNVYNYLRSKGINPYRMIYQGYGNSFPLGKGDEFDRRVEFLITKI